MSKSNQVLRNRILSNMQQYDDNQSINIQQSVPILNSAQILKILTSLEETKEKIKHGQITQGRYKQQAKFVYFLWKAIGKQQIKVQSFKYIIIELQQSHNFLQLIKNLQYVVSNCQENTIKKLYDSWSKLKQDRQYYQSIKKLKHQQKEKKKYSQNMRKNQYKNQSNSKLKYRQKQQPITQNNNTLNINIMNKTIKNIKQRRSRQNSSSITNNKSCKNLFNLNFINQMSISSIQASPKQTLNLKTRFKSKKEVDFTFVEKKFGIKNRQHLKTQTNDPVYIHLRTQQNQEKQSFQTSPNPKLNSNQQKLLIQRLYENKKYQQRQQLKNKFKIEFQQQQLKSCTFKPELVTQTQKGKKILRSSSQSKNMLDINGFQKAVTRMKVGHSKSKIKKQLEEYYSIGENYQKIKQKPINPPSFLHRKQNNAPQIILFVIQFQLGKRNKVKVKIHPTDTEVSVAKRLTKIYGLKKHEEDQIKEILGLELNNYYRQINSCYGQTRQFEQNENENNTIKNSIQKKELQKDIKNDDFQFQYENDEKVELHQLFKKIQ